MTRHLILFAISIVCFLPFAHAGKVAKVNGKKVYIVFDNNDGGTFAEGDYFFLTDGSGKKKALVQIRKIKGMKAIAELTKGKAARGYATVFKSAGKMKGEMSSDEGSAGSSGGGSGNHYDPLKSHWGALFGYGMAKQDVNQGSSTSAETGSSMAVRIAYEYPLLQKISLRMLGGVELFSVTGPGVPLASTAQATVGTDITYITFDGAAKWSFAHTANYGCTFYGFLGAGIFYPMSKSSDVIVESSIESLGVAEVGLGVALGWGKWQIPVDVTYYVFPSGQDVKTGIISLKAGIMF